MSDSQQNHQKVQKAIWGIFDQFWRGASLNDKEIFLPILALLFVFLKSSSNSGFSNDFIRQFNPTGNQSPGSYLSFALSKDSPGKALNRLMNSLELEIGLEPETLPRTFHTLPPQWLGNLLDYLAHLPFSEDDKFPEIIDEYLKQAVPYFKGSRGHDFTPESISRLLVEGLEPTEGRVFDPSCGTGGLLAECGRFARSQHYSELKLYGQDTVTDNIQITRLNLIGNQLNAHINKESSHFVLTNFESGSFDFAITNPPFNLNTTDLGNILSDWFPFGTPKLRNANYFWISLLYSALNKKGRASFLMAPSAFDAGGPELDMRKKLIQTGSVDVIIQLTTQLYLSSSLPCSIWFLDRGKPSSRKGTVLFIDGRDYFVQRDRTHRALSDEQIAFFRDLIRLYKGQKVRKRKTNNLIFDIVGTEYKDTRGLCRVVSLKEIEKNDWSLNPNLYVESKEEVKLDSVNSLKRLNRELDQLNEEAQKLGKLIAASNKKYN